MGPPSVVHHRARARAGPATFHLLDAQAGYWVSDEPVDVLSVQRVDDCVLALAAHDVELRVVPSLWPLVDVVTEHAAEFSAIRLRNAGPRGFQDVARAADPATPETSRTILHVHLRGHRGPCRGFHARGRLVPGPRVRPPVAEGAAIVVLPDGRFAHFARTCVRHVLGVTLTLEDLLAIEARRHAAFVMGLAHVHAAFVREDPDLCAGLLLTLEELRPATVAERIVLESARSRLELVVATGTVVETAEVVEA